MGRWNCGRATLAGKRSAEERVAEDWAAVGAAIKDRRTELGLSQIELGKKADVSKQVIYELENVVIRQRSPRTLKALSTTLGWHEGYLAAILAGHHPPSTDEPTPKSDDDISGHMSVVEHYLRELLVEVQTVNVRLNDLTTKVDAASRRACSDDGEMEGESQTTPTSSSSNDQTPATESPSRDSFSGDRERRHLS